MSGGVPLPMVCHKLVRMHSGACCMLEADAVCGLAAK